VKTDDIEVSQDRIIIRLSGAKIATFMDTNSMDPVLDSEANAIQVSPASSRDIQVGDIISYQVPENDYLTAHRVVETGVDLQGPYYITRGDNNPQNDAYKVRFSWVKSILVGIIY